MAEKSTQISKQQAPRCVNNGGSCAYALKFFNVTDHDIDMGLRHVKSKVKREFNRLAKRYHPDTRNGNKEKCWGGSKITKGTDFKRLNKLRKKIMKLQFMPLTIDNVETVLDIGKGYKSSRDVELPWD